MLAAFFGVLTGLASNEERARQLVSEHESARLSGVLGEPRVSALLSNPALDALK